ncbi:MAG: cupredoxin domain-containing protein [bacterium]
MTRMLFAAALVAFSSVAAAQSVPVTLSEWKVKLGHDTVQAGSVTFKVTNNGSMSHGFYVRGEGVDKGTQPIAVGQSQSLTVTLKPGTYEVFCPLSDQSHKGAGMLAKVTVTGGSPPAAPKKPETSSR